MQRLEWSSEISVFESGMDEEHQALFRLMEKLRRDLLQGKPADHIGRAFRQLSNDLGRHFLEEERLMRSSRYSGMHWHATQHQAGRTRLAALDAAAHGKRGESAISALDALAAWLIDHITLADRMFSAHLRNHQRPR